MGNSNSVIPGVKIKSHLPSRESWSETEEANENIAQADTIYSLTRFFLGDNLESIVDFLKRKGDPNSPEVFKDPLLHTCRNLMGHKPSSDHLMMDNSSGSFNNNSNRLSHSSSNSKKEAISKSTELWILFFKICLAIYMNQYEHAESMIGQIKRQTRYLFVPPLAEKYIIFYDGLVAAVLAFRSDQGRDFRRKLTVAQKKLKKLKVEKVGQDPTLWNKIFLLDGQIQACLGQYENALLLFHKSVDLAEREGFSHEQGLAYELSWRMCQACCRPVEAELYLGQAKTFYERWGAHAKVEQLGQ